MHTTRSQHTVGKQARQETIMTASCWARHEHSMVLDMQNVFMLPQHDALGTKIAYDLKEDAPPCLPLAAG